MADAMISAASAEALMLLLRAQKNSYEEMIKLSVAMREGVIHCDSDTVNNALKNQREQLDRIRNLETRREAMTRRIAAEIGAEPSELKLAHMAQRAEDGARERLNALGEELAAVVRRQREINEQNRSLMEMSLEIMRTVLTAMAESQQLSNTYSEKGSDGNERPGGNFFIRDV